MQITLPDELDKSVVWPIPKIAKRWDTFTEVAEDLLAQAGVPLVELPQKPRLGVRLQDLIAFEERWRAKEAKEKAEREAQEAEDAKRHTQAREQLRRRKEEADRIVAESQAKEKVQEAG